MKQLFKFLRTNQIDTVLRKLGKFYRIVNFVLAGLTLLWGIILAFQTHNFGAAVFSLLLTVLVTLIVLVGGLLIEALLKGFSIIVRNQYEEVVIKGADLEDNKSQTQSTYVEKLATLNELRENNLISEAEYQQRRNEILNTL